MKLWKVAVALVAVVLLVWAGAAARGRQEGFAAARPVSETAPAPRLVDVAPVEYLTAAVVGTQARITTFVADDGELRICDFVIDTYPGQCDEEDSLLLTGVEVEDLPIDHPQVGGNITSGEATLTVVKVSPDAVRMLSS